MSALDGRIRNDSNRSTARANISAERTASTILLRNRACALRKNAPQPLHQSDAKSWNIRNDGSPTLRQLLTQFSQLSETPKRFGTKHLLRVHPAFRTSRRGVAQQSGSAPPPSFPDPLSGYEKILVASFFTPKFPPATRVHSKPLRHRSPTSPLRPSAPTPGFMPPLLDFTRMELGQGGSLGRSSGCPAGPRPGWPRDRRRR
jgi:hypothetical protein